MSYDLLIVGAGMYGSIVAHEQAKRGKRVLVLDQRDHIGGNCFTEDIAGIQVHKYGAHIFHTSDKEVWDYVNSFVEFNRYTHSVVARWRNELYNLPFNMNTFHGLWGVKTPEEAQAKIESQRSEMEGKEPANLEEQAVSLVGRDIYERLIKGYTEKQWGRKCTELPAFIIKRLPVRFTFDNNYFNDRYQGIPIGGYTRIFEKLLEGVEVRLGVDYLPRRTEWDAMAERILFTGPIDAFYEYRFGKLEYRSVEFQTEVLDTPNFQGNSVVNYTEADVPYTRIIEHKHFESGEQPRTVISREYSREWREGDVPYYPVNDEKNNALFARYKQLADAEPRHFFGGRLADYRYYDMHHVVRKALDAVDRLVLARTAE